MAQKSILSFFGGAAKNKPKKTELDKVNDAAATKKKAIVDTIESDGKPRERRRGRCFVICVVEKFEKFELPIHSDYTGGRILITQFDIETSINLWLSGR